MTTRFTTCTEKGPNAAEACGGEIRPSFIGPAPIVGATAQKGDITYPATCPACGKTYPDIVSIPMTRADFDMVGDRMSETTRLELRATATELEPGGYAVELTEDRARDFASKAANLGLLPIATKIRHELNSLTSQRRKGSGA
jgi:hypothetical protein